MNKLKSIIETVISKEIDPDSGVFSDGYILQPFALRTELKGDGFPEELATQYQLDFFYKNRGETVSKARELIIKLGNYPLNDLSFTWEETARLWRGTILIEAI